MLNCCTGSWKGTPHTHRAHATTKLNERKMNEESEHEKKHTTNQQHTIHILQCLYVFYIIR